MTASPMPAPTPATPDVNPVEIARAFFVPIAEIVVPEDRARKDFSGVAGIAESIRHFERTLARTGGLIHPIVLRRNPAGQKELVAGECRLQAHLLEGRTRIAALWLEDLDALTQKEVELEENIRRKHFEWLEECEALRQIDELKKAQYGRAPTGTAANSAPATAWTTEKTAALVGRGESMVRRQIAFARELRERPDLAAKVSALPMTQAMKKLGQLKESERVEKLYLDGKVVRAADVLLGDARELIRAVASDSVGLIVTDPPFGIGQLVEMEGQDRSSSGGGHSATKAYAQLMKPDDNLDAESATALLVELAPEMFRVLTPGAHIYVFFAFECYAAWRGVLLAAGFAVEHVPLVWWKRRSTAPFTGYNYSPSFEPVLFGYKPPRLRQLAESNTTLLHDGGQAGFAVTPSSEKVHPFEKPPRLLEYFIKQSTSLGELVLDPFVGSGSTVLAARDTGRRGLGFEKNAEHYGNAQVRLLGTHGTPQPAGTKVVEMNDVDDDE